MHEWDGAASDVKYGFKDRSVYLRDRELLELT